MRQDYCAFSNLTPKELDRKIANSDNKDMLPTKGNMFLHNLKHNKNIILQALRSCDNTDINELAAKLNLFSPHMLRIISASNYKTCLEYLGGFGIMSELISEINNDVKVTYSNIDSEILEFVKHRVGDKFDIIKLNRNCEIKDNYDIIISDGNIQYFTKKEQGTIIRNMVDKLNPGGLLCLLVDISGKGSSPLYYDVDIDLLHKSINSEAKCIYGENTFSSLWKK